MMVRDSPDFLHPLAHFHGNGGEPLPAYRVLKGPELPEPYRTLLVHDGDMTSRLENFHGGPVELDVLHCEDAADVYRREVLLRMENTGQAVEYGAIEIQLEAFDDEVRAKIREGHTPLGGLLNQFDMIYRSEPRAFLEFSPDARMNALFGLSGAHLLYGRANLLRGEGDCELARIVEILRPAEDFSPGE